MREQRRNNFYAKTWRKNKLELGAFRGGQIEAELLLCAACEGKGPLSQSKFAQLMRQD